MLLEAEGANWYKRRINNIFQKHRRGRDSFSFGKCGAMDLALGGRAKGFVLNRITVRRVDTNTVQHRKQGHSFQQLFDY